MTNAKRNRLTVQIKKKSGYEPVLKSANISTVTTQAATISVIIPTYNDRTSLRKCLAAIASSSHTPHEVIVIDDASTDQSEDVVSPFGFRYIRLEKNGGQAVARNTGAKMASGDILFFVDSDVRIQSDTVEKVARAYLDPQVTVYQGLASKTPLNTDEGFGPQLLALRWYYLLRHIKEASFTYSHVLSIRKSAFDSVGGFNESFKPPGGGEEFDLGVRLREHYILHTDPELTVDHHFQKIWPRTKVVFQRAYVWASILMDSGKFETTVATLKESLIGLFSLLIVLTAPLGLINPALLGVPALFFCAHIILNTEFYSLLYQEKGAVFLVKSVFPNMLWTVSQTLGGLLGLTAATLKRVWIFFGDLAPVRYVRAFRFLFNKHPSHVVLYVTGRCDFKCAHCFYWQEIANAKVSEELTLDEMREISRKWGHIKFLSITGGEPTLRTNLDEIIHLFCRNNSVDNVVIHTHGAHTDRLLKTARKIAKAHPHTDFNFNISADDLGDAHDKIRGVPGSFAALEKTVQVLAAEKKNFKNITVTANTCAQAANQDNLKNIITYFSDRDDIDGFYVSIVRGDARDEDTKLVDVNKYKEAVQFLQHKKLINNYYDSYPLASIRRTLDFVCPEVVIETIQIMGGLFVIKNNAKDKSKRMVYNCQADRTVVVVNEYGDVFPCEMLGQGYGNIRDYDYDIVKLMAHEKARKLNNFIKGNNCCCTWECAQMNNIVFNWQAWPRLIAKWFKLEIIRRSA